MSAKSIIQSVLGNKAKTTAKSIVQDALEKARVSNKPERQGAEEGHQSEAEHKFDIAQQGDKKVIEVSFTLDPEMVATLGAAMPKGAKPDDRTDSLDTGSKDGGTSHDDVSEDAVRQKPASQTSEREFDQDEPASNDKSKLEQDGETSPSGVKAEDEAVVLDGRHSNTPIENCRAEDPMFCPYHGAQKMASMIMAEIANHMGVDPAKKGISVSVEKNGPDFTARATFPASTSLYDEQTIENSIWSFMRTKGIKNNLNRPDSNLSTTNQAERETTAQFSTESLRERMPQGYTDSDYDVAKAKQDLEIMNEWMDDLIEDFGDPNSDIDPQDLEDLMNRQMELEDLSGQAASGNPQAASQFKAAKKDFEEKYHDVRGIADLPQVKTVQDAEKMRDDIAGERHKAGDWWNAKEEIADLRKQLGLTTASGRALPMKTIQSKYPTLFGNWDKFKTKYENLFMGSLAKILGNGRSDTGANGKFSDAQQNGDLRKMKGALHTLKYATEEYSDLMPAYMKAMQDHKNDLLTYAKQNGITVVPYVPKQPPAPQQTTPGTASGSNSTSQTSTTATASTPTLQNVQSAISSVPAGIVSNIFQNQNGENIIQFTNGNTNYAQSLIPSLQQRFPNSKITFYPGTTSSSGADLIQIS